MNRRKHDSDVDVIEQIMADNRTRISEDARAEYARRAGIAVCGELAEIQALREEIRRLRGLGRAA